MHVTRTLLFAGTDTSSGTLGRILHLLASHQDAQARLREELEAARDYPGQDLSYDKLNELPYLEAICRETMRLYVIGINSTTGNFLTIFRRYNPVNLLPREYVLLSSSFHTLASRLTPTAEH